MSRREDCRRGRPGFSLVELLVTIAVIALLLGVLAPSLAGARESGRTARCGSNQRQMIAAWTMYAGDYSDRAMPLAYWSTADIGGGPQVFWWGTHGSPTTPPDFERGFLAPYLDAALSAGSVFECPSQPWGSYRAQGPARSPTSTYGYNGYYLSPAKTPGWGSSIAHRPWRRLADIPRPTSLLVFADTLLPSAAPPGATGPLPSNNALLDPPLLFTRSGGGAWSVNQSPTTAFRHGRGRAGSLGSVSAACADGHVESVRAEAGWLTHPTQGIGSVGGAALARYVPDWERWTWP